MEQVFVFIYAKGKEIKALNSKIVLIQPAYCQHFVSGSGF